MPMIDPATVKVTYGPNANKAVVPPAAEAVVRDLVARSGGSACVITSTMRDAPNQARVMFENLRATSVARQMALYGPAGQQVIRVYDASNRAGKSPDQIKADMTAKIVAIGPSSVSRHCGDPAKLCVVDIAPNSIPDPDRFLEEVVRDPRISAHFEPPKDPAFHLEIPVVPPAALATPTV